MMLVVTIPLLLDTVGIPSHCLWLPLEDTTLAIMSEVQLIHLFATASGFKAQD